MRSHSTLRTSKNQELRMTDLFDRFKKAYPKRDGANPWKPAEKKFVALVKSGVNPDLIIAGARQLTVEEHARGNVGTRFIPMAVTWLNQQRYADSAEVAPSAEPDQHWDAILDSYKRFNHWSRHAGPDPDSPACRCPVELLVKHGIRAKESAE
jgi:hypothetical protein